MKKQIIVVFVCFLAVGITAFCANVNKPWGNNSRNILAAQKLSQIPGIQSLAVLSHHDTVLVGILTNDGDDNGMIKQYAAKQLKEIFAEYKRCLLGIDGLWASAVVELPFYIDGGMKKEIIENRFRYLSGEKVSR